ncbi:complement factor H-like [Thunnus thynnus]|uniref:complement factor H-like n=1 Tax=Thunnus thynnus TaxID=8237 RepID=UPI00352995B1
MHVITRSWVILWIHTLTFVRSDDAGCQLSAFLSSREYDSNFDTSNLQTSYPRGKNVRVSCHVGHSGFFRMLCGENGWTYQGSKCKPRSCGHPGDAQFADFELDKGDDFVFGSQVVYTCHKGYQMVSRTNHRRCLAGGWDGVVPVCEALQCPVIHVDSNVQVMGDPEEANYGNVIRFRCKTSNQILHGFTEIYCDENGEWSGDAPKCEEITCDKPRIENGYVIGEIQTYKEDDILDFACNPKYKPSEERNSKCIKLGNTANWSPTPACEPVRCELTLPALKGTTYDPASRSFFPPGATVRVICGEKYGITTRQDPSAVSTCQDNGQWDIRPICQEVTCPNRKPQDVYYWNVVRWQRITLDDTTSYWCRSGYKKTDGADKLTCTRDGWSPDPPCQEIKCDRMVVPNADISNNYKQEYRKDEKAHYVCKGGQSRFTLTCTAKGWEGQSTCEDTTTCPKAEIENGFGIVISGTLHYACDVGYKLVTKGWWGEAKCNKRKWSAIQRCIDENSCGEVPNITNGRVIFGTDTDQGTFQINCNKGYLAQIHELTCQNGKWQSGKIPFKKICAPISEPCEAPPRVENAVVRGAYQKEYSSGSTVTYLCRQKYTMEGEGMITCTNGHWDKVDINCTLHCHMPEDEKDTMRVTEDKERYVHDDVIEYRCISPSEKAGSATCVNGEWDKPVTCKATCTVTDVLGKAKPNKYVEGAQLREGEKLRFYCSLRGQTLQGNKEVECLADGQWSGPFPTCGVRSRCGIPPRLANGETKTTTKHHYEHDERVEYTCKNHYIMEGKPFKTCNNGEWTGEMRCHLLAGCERPPVLENGDTTTSVKPRYEHNEKVEYICQKFYVMEGEPYQTCNNGEWTGEIICLKPCTVDKELLETHNLKFKHIDGDKLYSAHDDVIGFECVEGTTHDGIVGMRQNCIYGVMNLPTCHYACICTMTVKSMYPILSLQCYKRERHELETNTQEFFSENSICHKSMQLSLIFLLLQLWGNVEVSLSQNACSRLPDVPHAHVSEETKKSEYQEHDVIHFTCEPGYISYETSKYVCTHEGWLTVRQETCYSCSELPDVPHASISEETKKAEYQEGDTIHFTCDPGYISGPTIKYVCTSRGWLAVRLGTCSLSASSCDAPPANGGITVKGLPKNDDPIIPDHVLTFSCNCPGAILDGSSVLICGKDGQWDRPFPSCRADTCTVTGVPANVQVHEYVEGAHLRRGEKLRFYCPLLGHTLQGKDEVECLANRQWSGPFPTCGVRSRCGIPPRLANGETKTTTKHHYEHDERVEYTCKNHYIMEGKPFKTCNNGEWTGEMRCHLLAGCERPPVLENGDTTTSVKPRYEHNEKVEYICQKFYVMEGEPYQTCNNGEWTGEIICLKPCTVDKELLETHNLEFKHIDGDKLYSAHDDVIGFECVEGTTHDGIVGMRQNCIYGVMNLPTYACICTMTVKSMYPILSLQCYKRERHELETNTQEFFSENSICHKSMQLSLIFLLLQLWGNVEVSLSQNACSRLPDVPHAHVSEETKKSEYQEHDVIHFTCEPGYISYETSKYVCTHEGWLTVRQETCYSCSELPDVPHASISEETKKAEYQEGDTIHFTCDPGYISGPTIKYVCTSRGWLAVRLGTCSLSASSCDAPPANGGITVKGLPKNDDPIIPDHVLTFSCNCPGAILDGSSVLICGKDGQWDRPFPSCRADTCTVTGVPANVQVHEYVEGAHLRRGEKLRFYCPLLGHTLQGKDEVECLANRQWSGPFPTCGDPLRCGIPLRLANGFTKTTTKHHYEHDERVEYMCKNRYVMEGKPFKTCNNGEWTGEMRCHLPAGCERPPVLANGDTTTSVKPRYEHNERVEYICQKFYVMEGEPYQTCNNGEWTGEMKCLLPAGCERPPVLANGDTTTTVKPRYEHNEKVEYICQKFYVMEGEPYQTCNNGEWTGEMKCLIPAGCERPPVLANGDTTTSVKPRYEHNEKVEYICQKFYVMEGEPYQTCNNGEWTGEMKCLIPAGCERPPVLANGDTTTTAKPRYEHNERVEYICQKFYVMEGEPYQTCNNGEWTGEMKCLLPAGCERPPVLENGDTTTSVKPRYEHNERVEYICQRYYVMEGEPYQTCNNGEWTGEIKCLKPCTVDKELLRAHNLEVKHIRGDKLYSAHDDVIGFRCLIGTTHDGRVRMRQRCNDGVMDLPTCH